MDKDVCGDCGGEAMYSCMCSGGTLQLCVACLDAHSRTAGAHTLRKLKSEDSRQQTLLRLETGFLCQLCSVALASETCSCAFPLPLVCTACRVSHLASDMYAEHAFLPVDLYMRVKTQQQWESLRDYLLKVGFAEDACKDSLRLVAACEEALEKRHSKLLRKLDEEKRVKLEALARTKAALVNSVAKTLQQLKDNALKDSFTPQTAVAEKMWQFMQSMDTIETIDLFSFAVADEPTDIGDLFRVSWTSLEGSESHVQKTQDLPESTSCFMLLEQMRKRLSTEPQELLPESTEELKAVVAATVREVKSGRYRESLPCFDNASRSKPPYAAIRAKVALLALGEVLYSDKVAQRLSASPVSLAYKKQILEAVEVGLDSLLLSAQLKRADSSAESKEKQLLADLKVLAKAAKRDEPQVATPPTDTLEQSQHSLAALSRRGSLSLSQLLELKKLNSSDESLRLVERTVQHTQESLTAMFKVLVALSARDAPFEAVERLVNELMPAPATQFIPLGHTECLYETLRRHPGRRASPFDNRTSFYDQPEELCAFLLARETTLDFTLAAMKPAEVQLFDCRSRVWHSVLLNQSIRVDSKSSWAVLPIGDYFVCGGVWQKAAIADAYGINTNTQMVVRFPDMLSCRGMHGLTHYFSAVYVFGGYGSKGIKCCEKFRFTPPQWELLPDMSAPRYGFNPCEYRHLIYLIGGNSADGEVFDPLCESFAALSVSVPEVSNSCVFTVDDSFVLVTAHKIVRWSSRERGVVGAHKKFCAWGNMRPVVYGAEVYMVMLDCVCLPEKRGVQQLNMKTGAFAGFVPDEEKSPRV